MPPAICTVSRNPPPDQLISWALNLSYQKQPESLSPARSATSRSVWMLRGGQPSRPKRLPENCKKAIMSHCLWFAHND